MASNDLELEIIKNKCIDIDAEEKKILEDWTNAGLKIFLEGYQSRKSKQIHGDNSKSAKSSMAVDITKNGIGIGVGAAASVVMGPPGGKIVQGMTKVFISAVGDKVGNSIANGINEKKRNNILTWTNTSTKKSEKEFVVNVAHGMALICISFKDQIKSLSCSDYSKINFFNDVVRRIFNFLSENPAHSEQALSDKVIFQAFLLGRSIYKTFKWNRGLEIISNGKKWNTKEMFEDSGLIVPDGKGSIKLYTKKVTSKEYNCNEFRYVYPFEDQTALLLKYKELEFANSNLEVLKEDWRLEPNSTETFANGLTIQFPKDLEERKPTEHDREMKSMLQQIAENLQPNQSSKVKLLVKKWWPEKQVLVNSFYKRKNNDVYLVLTIMKKLSEDKNKMVVITHRDRVPGLGGIGKTSTAKWFANFFEDSYDFIVWIDCGEGSLLKSFKDLSRDLSLENRNELDLCSLARKCYEKIREWKCLFIYDNAECYQGTEGIKDILPHGEINFHCLITSRCPEGWGSATGYGEISQFPLGVFSTSESRQFLDKNIKQELSRSDYQLKQLSELLGNLPLALQLAVAALNSEKINLRDYIAKASAEDAGNIVDQTFDDYEKTINKNMQISLELIKEETGGKIAYDILLVFGYIRPENVEQAFLKEVLNLKYDTLETAVQLLVKYSLITKGGKIKQNINNRFIDKLLFRKKIEIEVDSLSIHRLVQQVIRHNEIISQNGTLEKILHCDGFLDYKIVPYAYADDKLRKKFIRIRKQLLKTESLVKLLMEGRYKEAIELSDLINSDLKKPTSLYNYAVCQEKHGNIGEALRILEGLENTFQDETKTYGFYGLGILKLDCKINKSMVYSKILNIKQLQLKSLLRERKDSEALELSENIHKEMNSSSSLYNYALCLERTGRTDAALEKFEHLFQTTEIIADSWYSNTLLVVEMNSYCRNIMQQTHTYEDWIQLIETNGWSQNFVTDKENFGTLTSLLQQWNYMCNDKINNNLDDQLNLWETPHKFLILAQIMRILCNSGKLNRATEIFNQLMETLKNSVTREKRNTIYYTELLRLMSNYDYYFSYCFDDEESPKIELEAIFGKSVKLKLWEFCENLYFPENLQELTLDSLSILDNKGQKLNNFNIDHLLSSNLKKLSLVSDIGFTEFTVSLELLKNVEYLTLVGCSVILTHNEQNITPKEMQLSNVSFLQDDYVVVNILLNNYVSFDNISKLILDNCSVKIDLSHSLNITMLYLDKINVLNWENSQWRVETLHLVDMPFITKNRMKIQVLNILNEYVDIDLRCIPENVQKLSLAASLTLPLSHESVSFPELKQLTLYSYCILNLPCFVHCSNITVLKLELEEKFCIELDSIPKSVRRIWLRGQTIEVIGDGVYNLDSIFLDGCALCDVEYVVAKFRSEIIVLTAKDCIKSSDFKFCKDMLEISYQCSIYIGNFYWKDMQDFFTYPLSVAVSKKAEYYKFQSGYGEAIEENDFENIIATVTKEA